MPDLQSFEGYAGETVSVLHQLAAMILNEGNPVDAGDAAGHLGVAQALTGHLRAFALNVSRGRLFLPLSVFTSNGVTEAEIFAGQTSEGLLAAHAQLTNLAADHLRKATVAIAALPKPLRPSFASAGLLPTQLRLVESQNEMPFSPPREIADWHKIALMTWWTWRNG